MSHFLLDTNVLSEFTKRDPDPAAILFLSDQARIWTSVLVHSEMFYGACALQPGKRRDNLLLQVSFLMDLLKGRVLPVGEQEARVAAEMRAKAKHSGNSVSWIDSLIAATAVVHNLIPVTRNVKDFEPLGVEVVNPWDAG